MKALPLLLATSLAANAAWLAGALLHDTPTAAARNVSASDRLPSNPAPTQAGAPDRPVTEADRPLAAALLSGTPEQLRDALLAVGLDHATIRQLVSTRIWKNYEARLRALRGGHDPDPDVWWKMPEAEAPANREQREEIRRLQKEAYAENTRILGVLPPAADNTWQQRKYGFLSAEKREQLQKTEQDYNELTADLNQDILGFRLPSDQEKIRYLQQEKQRDLEALLTPEELRAYDLRNSATANRLRWKMTRMNATEDEYLRIYGLQKQFDDVYNSENPSAAEQTPRDGGYREARQAAQKELNARIREVVGDDRYHDYILSADSGYQQLKAATLRFGLPANTPTDIYSLRDSIPATAATIADDPALDDSLKRERLAALANDVRTQIRSRFGAEAADVILKNNAFLWIDELDKGNIVTFDIDGQSTKRSLK